MTSKTKRARQGGNPNLALIHKFPINEITGLTYYAQF
jgi:hypothetical protein